MSTSAGRPWTRWAAYAVLLTVSVAGYFVIRRAGMGLSAPEISTVTASAGGGSDALLTHVLLALVVVLVAARLVGAAFRLLSQPPVMGEILAGILLGPSLLGRVAPDIHAFLLPKTVAPFLGVLSQMGVVLYMFLVGMELDPALLKKRGHAILSIAHASIVVPFLLGAGLALPLYPRLSPPTVSFTAFSLFLGISLSITAFPVLARILADQRLTRTRLGIVALTAAAINDATAWCLLGLVVSVVQAKLVGAWLAPVLVLGFVTFMLVAVRPLMRRLVVYYGHSGRLTQSVMAVVLVLLLLSALCTDAIGVHAVFGAFVVGAMIPHDSGLARDLTEKLEDLVVVLFLPAFFAFAGMKTELGLLSTWNDWALCGVIILVATVGKIGGSVGAARLVGMRWREALGLGVLLNTRGLMELVVLNIGLELGVVTPRLFTMLVVMALVTTLATTPLLALVHARGHRPLPEPQHDAAPPKAGPHGTGVLLPVSNPAGVKALVDLARYASPPDSAVALLALVRSSARIGFRDGDAAPPSPPVVQVVLDHVGTAGGVEVRTRFSDDPVEDICQAASATEIGWLLLGFHRPVWGSDLLGGVVKDVLERMTTSSVHVGVVVHRHEGPLGQIVAVVDAGRHGRAVLDLAVRVAKGSSAQLRLVVVPESGDEPEPELQDLMQKASAQVGKWMFTDVLRERNPAQLAWKTRGDLVLLGTDRANELGLPLDEDPEGGRCVVIVQGGQPRPTQAA